MHYIILTNDYTDTRLTYWPDDGAEAIDIYALVYCDGLGQPDREFDFKSAADLFDFADFDGADIINESVAHGVDVEAIEVDDDGTQWPGVVYVNATYHYFYAA